MAQTQRLQFIIDAQNNSEAALKSVSSSLEGVKGKLESFEPAFKKMAVAGTAAFVGVAAIVKSTTAAYAEAERAERQLYNAVVNVSKGTQEQVKAIQDVANALQKKAGIDGDALKMGAAQLSTFGLQSKSVVALTKSLADLTLNQNGVTASADDYVSSANVMAKALNGQFGVLEKSGIRFTELQQKMILTGTETEKVAALQEGLAQNLRETTDTIAGVDKASAIFNQTMGDIQESIGKAMVPALAKVSAALLPILEKFGAWAEQNPELLAKIILIVGALGGLVAVVGTIGLVLPTIITGFTMLGTAITFMLGPIGLVILAIGALVAAGVMIYKHWGEISAFAVEAWTNIKNTIVSALESISQFFMAIWEGIKTAFWTYVNFMIGIWATFLDFLFPGWQQALQGIWDTAVAIFTALGAFFAATWESIKAGMAAFLDPFITKWTQVWNAAKMAFVTVWEAIKSIFDSVIGGIRSGMESLVAPIQKVISLAERAMELAGGALKSAKSKVSDVISSVLSRGSSITGRAIGGPMSSGQQYLVGENGPELFTPNSFGRMQTAKATLGGQTINLYLTGNSFMGKEGVAEQIGNEIVRALQLRMKIS